MIANQNDIFSQRKYSTLDIELERGRAREREREEVRLT